MQKRRFSAALVLVLGASTLAACQGQTGDPSPTPSLDSSSEPDSSPSTDASPSGDAEAGPDFDKTVFIPTDGYEIPSAVTVPESASADVKVPAVVMLHGTGSVKDEVGDGYARLATDLAEAGIASVRIDFMGSGESTAADEDFDFENARADAITAADFLREQHFIDADKIGILGWSQGGMHALLAAEADPRFASVVTWAAPIDGMTVPDDLRAEADKEGFYTVEFPWREPMHVGQSWIDGLDALDLVKTTGAIEVPILALNGSDDDVVPPANAAEIAKYATHSDSTSTLIDGADHTFNILTEDPSAFEALSTATVERFGSTLQ